MISNRTILLSVSALFAAQGAVETWAQAPAPPSFMRSTLTNGQQRLRWTPYPAAQEYRLLRSSTPNGPFAADSSGAFSGNTWLGPLSSPAGFYRLQAVAMNTNALWVASVLNRLAYGPTPDDLERVTASGPAAYVAEQLAPEAIQETLNIDVISTNAGTGWQFFSSTGNGNSAARLLFYLNAPGNGYLDDIKLVRGTVAEVGTNLLRNGDFEAPLSTSDYSVVSIYSGSSRIVTNLQHSGNASLFISGISSGAANVNSSISQAVTPALIATNTYTLSYWFFPGSSTLSSPTVLLSSTIISNTPYPLSLRTKLEYSAATMEEMRAWHVLHAVRSNKQLLEVLLQFLDNHFVTQYSKSVDYFGFYGEGNIQNRSATRLEYRELERWRQALLNPTCTFKDLLRISGESPAMIVYLDTVNSRGDGRNVANENYARELLELFSFGVDNGYDQTDIVETSKTFTGWTLGFSDAANEFVPLGSRLISGVTSTATNFPTGVWAFTYNSARHNTNSKSIFLGKTIPARFGSPYAGRSYQLLLPARTGTNSLQDGYDVINHVADQAFTQEFLSVKLCRLFVHDNFAIGYDFTDPNLSEEGKLVRQCMTAWENGSPKGQIRQVLAAIFNSELFRSHGGSLQKVKTPLEYTVSAIRALRSAKSDGTYTSDTDGVISTPLSRMGSMNLFDRAEPDGYPETAPGWISTGTLAERIRWVQGYLIAANQSGHSDAGNSVSDPVTLLRNKLPTTSWTNAPAVSDYFLSVLYPAEGKANLELYRSAAVSFLNTADNGTTSSLFNLLSTTGNPSPYDTRLRGMVGMLMTLQRFHEQ